ncbi:glycerate kinase [Demequina globuliformis]|uniref:glycerate kinase n=1 Tax=Demequina globuliformis TaxID=676202 RepID=UPI000781949B|nr:glycerate kinase [Demequina globuliformis]
MKIVLALDSFKGTATAAQACAAVAEGIAAVAPTAEVVLVPMADGGEGTLDALSTAHGAAQHEVTVCGPDGRPVRARWLELKSTDSDRGAVAVVELAESSGITLMERLSPLEAHTVGLGEVMLAALDHGVEEMLIAVGGSASTDAGAGALEALGARFLDADGMVVDPGGRGLARIHDVDTRGLRRPPVRGATVLTDVTNPLCGPDGAAAVYGPQKGAEAADIEQLDAGLAHFASRTALAMAAWSGSEPVDPSAPGTGAAGGTGFGLATWGAQLRSGAAALADAAGVDDALVGADLVVVGEGRFDSQSAQGKVVSEVARRAGAAGVPTALIAGAIDAPTTDFTHAYALGDLAGSPQQAMADTAAWLRAAGAALATAYEETP